MYLHTPLCKHPHTHLAKVCHILTHRAKSFSPIVPVLKANMVPSASDGILEMTSSLEHLQGAGASPRGSGLLLEQRGWLQVML